MQLECDLLAAEIEQYRSGERGEYDYAPNGSRIDITELWVAYLLALLGVKRSVLRKLKDKYKAGASGPSDQHA
jgi:hypothetical protein